ncbi:MAG TPA: hypothetical protein VI072_02860 [Polyangiaceae bacterium]
MAQNATSTGNVRSSTNQRGGGANDKGRSSGGAAGAARAKGGAPKGGEAETGESDENYNLISVLYHALQGAQTYSGYIRDARAAGDDELVEFFSEVREEEQDRAERAKELLAARIGGDGEFDDEDDEDDED